MITPASLFISVGTSLLIFLFFLGLFVFFARQPRNAPIYFPLRMERDAPFDGNLWHSVQELFTADEDELVAVSGIDAAVYMRGLCACLHILLFATFYCVLVLLPICTYGNYYASTSDASTWNDFSVLSMGNIAPGSNEIWAFAIGVYWITFGTIFILFMTFNQITAMREKYLYREKPRPEQYGVLVQYIPKPPKGVQFGQFVDDFFRKLHPETFTKSLLISDIRKAVKLHKKLDENRRKLARAKAIFAHKKSENETGSKTKNKNKIRSGSKIDDFRPREKIGLFQRFGKEVDSIDHHSKNVEILEKELEIERENFKFPEKVSSALVFFNNRRTATEASQTVQATRVDTWHVSQAPGPTEIIWENLNIGFFERWMREIIVLGIVFCYDFLLYALTEQVPITLISSFTTLTELTTLLPFLTPITNITIIGTLLEAYLPQLGLLTFTALLPYFLQYISHLEGYYSYSTVVRAAVSKKFIFSVLNEFIGVTLTAGLFDSLSSIIENPTSVISLLGTSLPENATFFISYIALKFLLGYGLEISRLVYFLTYYAERAYFLKTDQDVNELWTPQAFSYVNYVPNDLLVVVLGLCYAVISPTILPFAIFYFVLGWLVLKHQMLNVYHPIYESGGKLWPLVHRNIIGALLVSQITAIGYFGIKEFVYTPILVPLPLITIAYYYYCDKRFEPVYRVASLEMTVKPVERDLETDEIIKKYLPESVGGEYSGMYFTEKKRKIEDSSGIERIEVRGDVA